MDDLKRQAAEGAVLHIESGMRVGLGTGSTARYAIDAIGRLLSEGSLKNICGVPTSQASTEQAQRLGIPLGDLTAEGVDVAIDGMDEVTDTLDAIKGLGGAMTREKIVAARASLFILIGDESKRVKRIGEKAPVPVEVVPFGYRAAQAELESLGCQAKLRHKGDEPVITDNGNYVLDLYFTDAFDPLEMDTRIKRVTGVLEHGLFLRVARIAYVATSEGVVTLRRE